MSNLKKSENKYKKHQKLPEIEAIWCYDYIMKKHQNGVNLTIYKEPSLQKQAIEMLKASHNNSLDIQDWVEQHLAPDSLNKLKLNIRAKRKRYFDRLNISDIKKNITISHQAWKSLQEYADSKGLDLSNAIEELCKQKLD